MLRLPVAAIRERSMDLPKLYKSVQRLIWILFSGVAISSATAATSNQGTVAPDLSSSGNLCGYSGRINLETAKRLRDELGQPMRKARAVQIRKAIGAAVSRCHRTLTPATVTFLGNLYVRAGERFLRLHDFPDATGSFGDAERLFPDPSQPSLVLLAALQGNARSEFGLGHAHAAEGLISQQVALVRGWVEAHEFDSSLLVYALRVGAQIYDAEGQSAKAKALLDEAERIGSSAGKP